MVRVTELAYPAKSHRKKVTIPTESTKLAEFFGIVIGDGSINNPWQANITLNAIADATYIEYVRNLTEELFGAKPRVMYRRATNATIIFLASTTIVDFLVKKGLARGNKLAQGLRIPDWILAVKAYKMACVRGLFDTDGCLILARNGREIWLYSKKDVERYIHIIGSSNDRLLRVYRSWRGG
ncbi:MAG TPA: hypothetical protein VNM40_02450 [Candidatus Paceibacterota bacterium]|nr:hypothetical protein [Candidatus Paceibacterota bacterium]